MGEDDVGSSVKLPVFTGEESKYQMWIKRFKAFARVKNFSEALKRDANLLDSEADWKALARTNAKYKHGVKNNVAVPQLTLALDDPLLMNLISKSETADWPGGVAWKVMELLENKYNPKDRISRIEMMRRMNKVRMTEKENPDTLFL